jgi:GMP synthase PP-ATPase subunit
MFALGPGFDEDERYPWAGPILGARIVGKVKMDKICARAAEALARGGDEGA